MSSSGKSSNPTKPGSISLQNLPNDNMSNEKLKKVLILGRQVRFLLALRLPKPTKKPRDGKRSKPKKTSVNPYTIPLPSTFHWSPEIAEVVKKRDQWDDINAMANNEFQTSVSKTFGSLPPSDASLASYLQKRKNQGKSLSPADEKYLQACHQQCKPVTGFWPQNEKAMAEFVKGPWPFGDLPEKVCSLASYCRKRNQQGLPLTPAQERFFQHLVDLHQKDLNEGPTIRCVNF